MRKTLIKNTLKFLIKIVKIINKVKASFYKVSIYRLYL